MRRVRWPPPCRRPACPACGAEGELLRLLDQLLERVGRRLDAALLQQRLVVEEAMVAVRTGTAISLPPIVIAETSPAAMSSKCFDRRLGLVVVQRLQQRRRRWRSRGCSPGSRRRNRSGPGSPRATAGPATDRCRTSFQAISASCAARQGAVRSPATPVVRQSWCTRWHSTFSVCDAARARPTPLQQSGGRQRCAEGAATCQPCRHAMAFLPSGALFAFSP